MNKPVLSNPRRSPSPQSNSGPSVALALALVLAGSLPSSAQVIWDAGGDGVTWTDRLNWDTDAVPGLTDLTAFLTPGTIQQNGNQSIGSLTFQDTFAIGSSGNSSVLSIVGSTTSANISIDPGVLATINTRLTTSGSTPGLYVGGGGTLFLTNQTNFNTGPITVDGSTLMFAYPGQPSAINRSDALALGAGSRTINLINGGEYKFIGSSYNPDGTTKVIALGAGGGKVNVAAGFQHLSLDDAGQITAIAGSKLTKTGNGTLQLASQDFNLDLTGGVIIDRGLLRLSRVQGNTANGRFSAFTAASPITINNGGKLVLETTTQGILNNDVTLNPGGVLAINGAEHNIGARDGTANSLTLNGGTILVRDGFNPQSSGRLPRIDAKLTGAGTVDLIGGTANAGNSRFVIQRSDVGSDFSGTFVVHGNTAIEQNPRDNDTNVDIGNSLGNSTVDLRGYNAALDLRDSDPINGNLAAYSNVKLTLSGEPGSIGRLSVNRSTVATGTGNVYQLSNFTTGSNRLYMTNGNNFGMRFAGSVALTGANVARPVLDINSAGGKLEFNGSWNEHIAGDGLVLTGRNGNFDFSGQLNLTSTTLFARETRLFGANGSINPGSLSGVGELIVDSGYAGITGTSTSSGTVLHLNNNLANTGGSVAAATNGDRLNNNVLIALLGDSVLRLTSQNGVAVNEITGDIAAVLGRPTVDLVKTGTLAAPMSITLGSSAPALGTGASANLIGTNLGAASADSSRILIPGMVSTPWMGANIVSGNEWAAYDTTVNNGLFLGVIPWVDATYGAGLNAAEGTWGAGMAVKLNGAAGTSLTANRNADTLNLQFSAANQAIATAGNLLTVERSGIITATNTSGITGTAAGGLTAGTGSPTELHITNNATLDLNAIVQDNGAGGVVTLVKNGTGTIRLTNQGFAVGGGVGAIGSVIPATHTNTFSGGMIINQGIVSAWRPEYLGTGNTITINGGALEMNVPVTAATVSATGMLTSLGGNNSIINVGKNIVFNTSGGLYADDNGEGNDATVGGNATLKFGSLTINGEHVVGIGAYANGQLAAAPTGSSAEDFLFQNGANFSGTPILNIGVGRSGGAVTVINGALTGSAFRLEGQGTAVGALQLGNGGTDTTANTYTGTITIQRTSADGDPILRLNKANGVNAVTGDIIINGGTLAWGPGSIGDYGSNVTIQGSIGVNGANAFSPNNLIANQFTGNVLPSDFANTTSGADQIPDNATITLMYGTVNESARATYEKFGTLRQLNGNFNTGVGVIEVDNYTMSGGSISFNSGGTFKAGTVNLLSGAQDINIANNFSGTVTTFEVGAGGIAFNGQNLSFGNGDYFTPSAGAVLKLGGNMSVQADPLNFLNEDRQRGFFVGATNSGRELGPNFVDFMGANRTISVADNIFYTLNVQLRNGGIVKEGDGSLAVQNWFDNNYSGGLTVNNGIFLGRSRTAAGSGAIDINSGGTLKIDGGWTWGNAVTLSGAGADIPQSGGILEQGALVSESGQNRLTGQVTIDGNATIASNLYQVPNTSRLDAAGGVGAAAPLVQSNLRIEHANGVAGTGDLTLAGGGNGTIVNGVNVSGGLTKTGNGTWTIGRSTYAGATSVEAGVLRATDSASLGTAAQGTTVYGGATLQLDNSGASAETVTAHGLGQDSLRGAVESLGTSGLRQVIIGTTPTALNSRNGTLTISQGITGGIEGNSTILTGAGNGVVSGAVSGSVSTAAGLIKNGTGAWTLNGTNTYAGSTVVNGGSLAIGGTFPSSSALTLNGGRFSSLSGAGLTTNGLTIASGGGNLDGGANGVNVGAIVRQLGGTANFAGSVTTTNGNTNGILGGWATYGDDWAVGGGLMSGYTGYTTLTNATGILASTDQGILGYDGYGFANAQHTVSVASDTLKLAANLQGLQTGANNVTLGAGGLLKTGSSIFNLGGTGNVAGLTPNDDLNVHVNGGGLYVSQALIGVGSGNLNKAGSGDLRAFGASGYTGSINITGGTFSIAAPPTFASTTAASPSTIGSSVMNGNRVINLNGGTFAMLGGGWDLNDWDTVTAGVQSIQFNIGSAGGTLYSGNGDLLINDTAQVNGGSQLMGSGDLRIAGGGRVLIDNAFPLFTGDITVTSGVLRLANGANGNQSVAQRVTLQTGTALIVNTDLTQTMEFQGNNQITVVGADRAIRGPVSLNGNINVVMQERDTVATARSLEFAGPISGSGTINISGTNTNGRVQFAGGFSSYNGIVNVGSNSTLEIRQPGSMGTDLAAPTVNLNGSRSRLMLRHYQNGDWNLNVNAAGKFTEIYSGRLDNYGLSNQGLFSINNLTSSANNYLTLTGDNNNWTTLRGSFTGAGNQDIVTNSNAIFLNGGTVGANLVKRGGSVLATEGTLAVGGNTVIQQGWIDLRGASGKLTTSAIELRGGNLMVSNNVGNGSDPNRIAGIPITMGGGSLRVVGTTNLGTISVVAGTNEINYAMDTQSGVTPLVVNDFVATRSAGTQIRVGSTYGTIGAPTTTNTNPRIVVAGMADTFGTGLAGSVDIIPSMVFGNVGGGGNEFVAYRTTIASGAPLGFVQVTNGSMRSDAADGTGANQLRSATASTEIMRFTGTTTTTLGGNATWRAIKMDGGTTRTLDLGTNTLTVDRGAIIHVANTQRIGANTGTGFLTSGNRELQVTVNSGQLVIGAVIQDGSAGSVSLVKNGTAELRMDGANNNTFTGSVYLNNGVLATNRLGHVPVASTVYFNGGRWEPSPTAAAAADVLVQGNNLVVNTTSTGLGGQPALSLDNGTGPQDNDISFGSVTINNGVEWSIAGWDSVDGIFNATGANPHSFNGTPTIQLFQSRTAAAAAESTMTFSGPITGSGFYVQSVGARAATNPNDVTMNIGGGASDSLANTYTGDFVILGTGATNSFPIVRLNKAAGTTALTGDVYVNGGQLISLASNQIADAANVTVQNDPSGSNQMGWNMNNQSETINNLVINSGGVSTGTGTLTANNITVNMGSQGDNLQINSAGGTVVANGALTVNDFGNITLGASAATLVVNGGLTMTGGRITQNSGAGANIVRLNSDVTATSSAGQDARLGNSTDSDTFLELNGTRTFDVADGNMGYDLNVSTVVRNSTAVGATAGGIIKNGAGLMILQGGGTANSYTGPTIVNQGTLQLFKSVNVNAVPGNLTIGAAGLAAKVEVRNSNQIADAADVSIGSLGILDLQTNNTSEGVRNLSSVAGGMTTLGPASALSVNITADTVYGGSIVGGGATAAVTKTGAGKWTLTGISEFSGDTQVNAGTLEVDGFLNGSTTQVNSTGILQGIGTVSDVVLNVGGSLNPGTSPGILTTRNLSTTGGTVNFEIGGLTAGNGAGFHDQLNTLGTVNITGTTVVTFSLFGGYAPGVADYYFLIKNDGTDPITGTFDLLPEGTPVILGGNTYYATYLANAEANSLTGGNDFALIPEPGTASLAFGALGLLFFRRRRATA